MHKLNIFNIPLKGKILIESSAGTGKTFTIIIIYIRLILGINTKYLYKKPLSVKKILILTYTNYGSLEIKKKIYENINILLRSCIEKKCSNNILLKIFKKIKDFKTSIKILLKAKKQINNASIFTIHVFCKKILETYALELNIPFKYKLLKNKSILYEQSVINFWRKYFYKLEFNIVKYIVYKIKTPKNLLKIISPWLNGKLPNFENIPIKKESILLKKFKEIIEIIKKIKKKWNKNKNKIISIILSLKVNKKIYNKKNLLIWFNKITNWVYDKNTIEFIPKILKYFRISIINKNKKITDIKKYKIFYFIEELFNKKSSLYYHIISFAIIKTREIIKKEKVNKNLISFDDLINVINTSIKNKNFKKISKKINKKYPVTIIDEFQDTDYNQYKIFDNIYNKKKKFTLLLVGDPKQAIYDFRNADIFSYIKITSKISKKFNLITNWRSSPRIVKSINKIFSIKDKPFVLDKIPFTKSKYNKINSNLSFILNKKKQPAIKIWYIENNELNYSNNKLSIAQKCAYEICSWLKYSKKNKSYIVNKIKMSKPLCPSDITILVKNNKEAKIICKTFKKNNLQTFYLSNNNNIYSTNEAKEILLILKATINPENINILKNSLITNIINFNIFEISKIEKNKNLYYTFIKKFKSYYQIWKKFGIISLFNIILSDFNIIKNYNIIDNNEQKIINILHIGELLHKIYYETNNKNNIINYLEKKINNTEKTKKNEQIRYNNIHNKIKVMTIHKSKGLEFPIVWIPFITNYNKINRNIYHNRNNFNKVLNLQKNNKKLIEEEILSENIRKFYVALTRAIYNCNIVVILTNKKKETNINNQNELNYLINNKNELNFKKYLINFQKIFSKNEINISYFKNKKNINYNEINFIKEKEKIYYLKHTLKNNSQINSFSSIKKEELKNKKLYIKKNIKKNNILTPHNFPRGKYYGNFLHKLLENIDFNKPLNYNFINKKIKNIELNKNWTPIIIDWLKNILNKQLNKKNICLSKIKKNKYKKELKFYIKIKKIITKNIFNKMMCYYDNISLQSPKLKFNKLSGILTGSIDMIFNWQNKYYLIDYKSNWLGYSDKSYSYMKLKNTIIQYRYDLQYNIYALALHKYLKQKMKNYKFEKNFGGIFYLFIRGINNNNKHGIFFKKIKFNFVNEFNKFFK
ncbi:Exodeoxyribonuclease V beta chain [Candidatus Purcelliella pentastirinorum]|uniref:RecBCD enzyme subunit RecB n=1 Tax=Candidatus Purcelliella pentastirinorum TaxID=472834 RepID=A0A346DZ97_9ENTR|nr:exodeoxyribonuclease V subunit beta [Candidatus Purcelliella pentastirinorum]AXN02052.1 Exodeoxyribonuclease V beta chain [Candidatus Purcelliella pentastirinorum]